MATTELVTDVWKAFEFIVALAWSVFFSRTVASILNLKILLSDLSTTLKVNYFCEPVSNTLRKRLDVQTPEPSGAKVHFLVRFYLFEFLQIPTLILSLEILSCDAVASCNASCTFPQSAF